MQMSNLAQQIKVCKPNNAFSLLVPFGLANIQTLFVIYVGEVQKCTCLSFQKSCELITSCACADCDQ